MTITLTSAEIAMLSDMVIDRESVEEVLHRILLPFIIKHGESRLQRLADEYRSLSPDLQSEALAVLKQWKASKV